MKLTANDLKIFLRLPEVDRSELGRQIDQFVRDELGMTIADAMAYSSLLRARFAFRIDDNGANVKAKPFAEGMRQWEWNFAVSCRAPLITCRTYSVKPAMDQDGRHPGTFYDLDKPPRAEAVDWTQRIARQFKLTYVEATALRKVSVSYDDVDPAFDGALEHDPDEPDAFQVLFLEY
jgi:hypothetical protein